MIVLFDIQDGKVIPTTHCYTLKTLKDIMDKFPDDHLQIYQYVFYMTCPNQELNPFFNMPEEEKEELILKEVSLNVSLDDPLIIAALTFCNTLYETATVRMHRGLKTMIDRMATYLASTPVTHGRDGNINSLLRAGKDFDGIRKAFKSASQDLQEEQRSVARGKGDYDGRH